MAVASTLAGRRDVAAAVEGELAARSDDPFARLAGVAELRAALGDTAGVAKARAAIAEVSPIDPSIRLAAFESAVHAGADATIAGAARAMLATTEDRAIGLQRLLASSRKAMRDELALPALRDTLRAFPTDGSMRWAAFEAAARAGAWAEAEAAASAWEALSASPRRAAAEVVATASAQLGVALVRSRLATLHDGLKDASVSRALVFASFLAFREGRTGEGTRLAEAAASLAPDPAEVAAIVAQDALVDADVPPGAAESVAAVAARAGRDPSALPVIAAARCLLLPSDGETQARCADRLQGIGWKASGLVAAAAARSLASGDVVLATTLARLASGMDGSRPLRVHLASQVMTCLGAASSADPADRRRAGEDALALLESQGLRPDPSLAVVRTHLVEMTRGLGPAVAGYEADLRWAPADAGLHNNLGYLVEIAGGDLDLAVRSARVAEVLMSSSNGFYVETEAWAEFLRGRTREALGLQERARRLWSLEQEGGLAESFVHYGRMLEKAGRAAEAREAYRRAATLEPTRCAAREALARWRALGVGVGGETR
jgi:tetratricopeptide (TPR) repeat protein